MKIVFSGMVYGMDAEMVLRKDGVETLMTWVNHPNYRNSVMYIAYGCHGCPKDDYEAMKRIIKGDHLDALAYPEMHFSIHEALATIEEFKRKGYSFTSSEDW